VVELVLAGVLAERGLTAGVPAGVKVVARVVRSEWSFEPVPRGKTAIRVCRRAMNVVNVSCDRASA
jgi:hypothetical protein